MLLRDTVHLVKPDLMVQIDSFNQAVNLPALTPEFIAKGDGWMYNKTPVLSIFAQIFHSLIPLKTTVDGPLLESHRQPTCHYYVSTL